MRYFSCLIMAVLLAGSSVLADTALYVAPGGKDSNPGTQQAPLATLAGARDRVRQVKREKPGVPIEVVFAAGTYWLAALPPCGCFRSFNELE